MWSWNYENVFSRRASVNSGSNRANPRERCAMSWSEVLFIGFCVAVCSIQIIRFVG